MESFPLRVRNGVMNRSRHNSRKSEIYGMALCLFVAAFANSLAAQQSSRALFNGKDLDGCQPARPGSLVVQHRMMKTEGGMGMPWYTREKTARATIRAVFQLTA